MEKVKQYFLKDEKILWERSKVVNLLLFIPISGLCYFMFILIFSLILIYFLLNLMEVIEVFVVGFICYGILLGGGIVLLKEAYEEYKKRKKAVGGDELKKYEHYEIITNKRYIRRDYKLNFSRNLDFSVYPEEVLDIVEENILFLDLNKVDQVELNYHEKCIYLMVKIDEQDYAASVFIEYKGDEFDEIMKILTENFSFEKKKHYRGYFIYEKSINQENV